MTTFQKVKLVDVARVVDCPHSTPNWEENGIFVVRNFNLSNGRIIKEKTSFVSEEAFVERTRRAKPQKGDSILSREAPIGSVGYINSDEKMCLGQRVVLIRPEKVDSRFLMYQLISKTVQDQFKQSDRTGSTVSNLRIPLIENTFLNLPDSITQIKIASVISSYDDLIENNEKRIKILEEMAKLLYHEWFVKFKFPGHESVNMIESNTQYGKIPDGWEVKKLDRVASIVRGCSYSSEEIDDNLGKYYIVNLKNFNRGGGFRFDGAKYYSGQPNNNQILKTGDIVVAVTDMTNDRAVIARPARVPEIKGDITFSADVVKINSTSLPSIFIYEVMSSYRFTETTKKKANGANVLHLKPSAILEFETVIPTPELLKQYDLLCYPVAREIDKLIKQNENLIKTRDLLIPQLITGKRELK